MADIRPKARRASAREEPARTPYERKPGSRVWVRPQFAGIGYSDGDEAERQLLSVLQRARDVSSSSLELGAAIEGWVQEAHLSPARSNLLRPLDFGAARHVLELGAGCGALTRYLGERGLEVDAVEGNLTRAECAAERCRDLEKVRVFADEITAFRPDRKYDVVTLIGVLEYSRLFIEGDDPVRSCLEMARAHLAPGGVLVLAIENQLGLKYFNGCAEDHLGTAYSGITDLYARKTAVTFGKLELEARLREAGFGRVDWAFPFPDYKLATSVISARGLDDPDFRAGDMLLGELSRDYGGSILRAFDESAVWSVLERNGLLADFANSFLVVAAPGGDNPLDDGRWLAYRFSPQRLPRFAAQTRFARGDRGAIRVSKSVVDEPEATMPVGIDGELRVEQHLGEQPYVAGRLLAKDFIDAVARGYAPRELAAHLEPWIDYLVARAASPEGKPLSALRISGEYLDCIPTNLVVDEKGALQPIDLEFVVPGDIPLAWIALRGTVHLASKCFGHRELARTTFRAFLGEMMPALGFDDVEDWKPYYELEDCLIRAVLRPWKGRPAQDILRARLELPICTVQSMLEYAHALGLSDAARRYGLETLETGQALVGDFARWLGMLPHPADTAATDLTAAPPALLELSDRIAADLERVTGGKFGERMRELASLRSRWAALARDNLRLSWQLGETQRTVEELRALVGREEEELDAAAQSLWQLEARGEGSVSALHSELSAQKEIAQRQAAAVRELQAQVEAARERLHAMEVAQAREHGRHLAVSEERDALRAELRALRGHVENLLNRLKRRSAEVTRVHRHLREARARAGASTRELARVTSAATWRFTGPLRGLYQRLQRVSTAVRTRPPASEALPKEPAALARLQQRAAAVAACGLFDAAWYARAYPQAAASGQDPLLHYLHSGWRNGLRPNALFHEEWYRRNNAATLQPDESGLEHYQRVGATAGAQPNPLFDPDWYLNANPDVRGYAAGPFHHFLWNGAREGRDPHPLFDTDWFLAEYPEAAANAAEVHPLAYFLDDAARTGHSPCELFDAEWYLSQYPDVEAAGSNPLLHYLEHGAAEGRDPSPDFDTRWYLEDNPDVAASGMNPLVHYVAAGLREGRLPRRRATSTTPGFDLSAPFPTPAPAANGVVEWEAYEPLKQRIAAEARRALAEVVPVPPALVTVEESAIDEAIAGLSFTVHGTPRVSIVIPVFNKLALTLECLQSIAQAGSAGSYEIVIADDGSTDGSGERLAGIPGVVVHRNPDNLGFLRNCNAAFPLARGEYVVLLNNDVQVSAGWLDALLDTFSAFDRVGAVGPKIVYPSGHLQEAGVAVRSDGSVEMVGLNDDPRKERYNYARPVDYVSGACLVMKTQLLRELGGFSEEFAPCYCEDSDLCMRIAARGLRIIYQPAATIVHHLSKTTADAASDVKLASVANSVNRFVQKWQEELDRLSSVRVLAFYLPQFHPIPENDHWWGQGFTEWANVARARPNFLGHYQPRLPADLGFYDLRLPEVMDAQAELAQRYGLHGWCCYYYWFAGKRLLEAPIERMLATGRPDIPYCLCWANENWTRRWDGEDRDILIAQKYSPEDDEAVILDLIRHFRGKNYIRIDGKPVLLVYRVSMFPDFRATAERWRRICRREGVGDIYLAMVESFDLVHAGANPADYNCDASVEFPPLGMAQTRAPSGPIVNPDFSGRVADYRDIAARFCARPMPGHTRLRGVMPGWDNTARRQNNSFCFEEATPGAFQAWLETAIAHTRAQQQGDERIVFVNAWNEWAEGAYLEPDRRFGHAFLEAVRNAQDADRLLRMNRYALDL